MSNEVFGLTATTIAGMFLSVGAIIGVFFGERLNKYIYLSLGFSAGVMIYAGFMEVLPHGIEHLHEAFPNERIGSLIALIGFIVGAFIANSIDRFIPHAHVEGHDYCGIDQKHILRLGIISAIAIGIHNLLEGIAVYITFVNGISSGLGLAISVAIHNIPVGMAIALPVYYATNKVSKSIGIASLSGLATGIGAILAHIFLRQFLGEAVLGFIFAIVSGMMIYISFDEILPTANKCGDTHKVVFGVMIGMVVMSLALLLLGHNHHGM